MQTIYILHGWAVRDGGLSKQKWQPFIDQLKLAGYKVVFLNIPGLTAPLDDAWGLEEYRLWLESQLEKRADDQKIILIGHSFGGQLAIRFTAKNSQIVEKLVLIDSSGIKDMSFGKVLKRNIFFIISKLGKIIFRGEFFRNILYKIVREEDYQQASPLLRKTMSKILNEQIIDDLPKIYCPTKIIWGELDLVTPIKHAEKIDKLIKYSELNVVKGAKHSPQYSHPIETAKLVTQFIL